MYINVTSIVNRLFHVVTPPYHELPPTTNDMGRKQDVNMRVKSAICRNLTKNENWQSEASSLTEEMIRERM